jgi:hypothetical protein
MGRPQPIASKFSTRDGTLAKDSAVINGYIEPDDDGGSVVILRPGMVLSSNSPNLPGSPGQGIVAVGPIPSARAVVAVFNDTAYTITPTGIASKAFPGVVTAGAPYVTLAVDTGSNGSFTCYQSFSGLWTDSTAGSSVSNPTKVSNANYPTNQSPIIDTAPGFVYLDGTFYVMSSGHAGTQVLGGVIYGSSIFDPTTWTALNNIIVDAALGYPVRLWKHLNYILAMCSQGIQIFYDAGNPSPGSPLSPVPNAEMNIGCGAPFSVAKLKDATIFVGVSPGQGRCVCLLEGLTLNIISDTFIERVLDNDNFSSVHATAMSAFGHDIYILNLGNSNFSLVYDLKSQLWTVWQTGGNVFTGSFYANGGTNSADYMQGLSDGQAYILTPNAAQDAGSNITMTITTDSDAYGSMDKKFCQVLYLDADTVNATVNVSYSDNDYQTFSTPYPIALNTLRKQMRSLGSFFYRAFKFVYSGGVQVRLYTFQLGESEEK